MGIQEFSGSKYAKINLSAKTKNSPSAGKGALTFFYYIFFHKISYYFAFPYIAEKKQ